MRDFNTDPRDVTWKEWVQKSVVPPPPPPRSEPLHRQWIAAVFTYSYTQLKHQKLKLKIQIIHGTTGSPSDTVAFRGHPRATNMA